MFIAAVAGGAVGGPVGAGVGAALGRHLGVTAADALTGTDTVLVDAPDYSSQVQAQKEKSMSDTLAIVFVVILLLGVAGLLWRVYSLGKEQDEQWDIVKKLEADVALLKAKP